MKYTIPRGPSRVAAALLLGAAALAAFAVDAILLRTMMLRLHMNDFGKFYYSARAYLDGGDMYAPSPATNLHFAQAPDLQYLNMNPPHFHLVILPLARLRPDDALLVWMAVSVFAVIVAILLMAHELGVRWTPTGALLAACLALAPAWTEASVVTGQLSMLLLLPITVCWTLARRGRWTAAGICLGACLSIKPFLLIFLPFLAARRQWRSMLAAVATAATGYLAGLLVFGMDAYRSWYRAVGQSGDWAWASMNASALGFFRRTFDANPSVAAWFVQPSLVWLWIVCAGVIGLVSLAVAVDRRTSNTIDRAFAVLLVGAQLVSPLGWIYYVPLAAGPATALVLSWSRNRRGVNIVQGALASTAIAGFLWPLMWLGMGQPHAWATISIASIYFWATLAAWLWIVIG